ncbi:MAG: hypothetical protein HQ581_15505 [Planctomycetes bacterium]|nr:hypothetical protein [Planctomycetota bacterium]
MSPAADAIVGRLDSIRQQWWFFTLTTTAVLAVCLSMGAMLALLVADSLMVFSQPMLWLLAGGWLLLTVVLIVLVCRRSIRAQRGLEATARRVEMAHPELQSSLMNVLQLANDGRQSNPALRDAAVAQAASRVGRMSFQGVAARQSRRERFLCRMQTRRDLAEASLTLLLLIVTAGVLGTVFPQWSSAADRMMAPWTFTPSVGAVGEIEVTPGDTEIQIGSSLEIAGRIANPDGQTFDAMLFVSYTNDDGEVDREEEFPLSAGEDPGRYALTMESVTQPLDYRLEIGDSQSPIHHIGLLDKPTVAEIEVTLKYPKYLDRTAEPYTTTQPDLEGVPQFTVAHLRVRGSDRISRGHVALAGQKYPGSVEEEGQILEVDVPLLRDTTFTIHLFNTAGHTDPNPRVNRIRVLPDKPPTVKLLKPVRESAVEPGGVIPVAIQAGDDHGVGWVRLEMRVSTPADDSGQTGAEDYGPAEKVKEWSKFETPTAVSTFLEIPLDAEKVLVKQAVQVRAVVQDRRYFAQWGEELLPQQATTAWQTVRIVDGESRAEEAIEQLQSIRAALWKILRTQVTARVRASTIRQHDELSQRDEMAGEVRRLQLDVRKAATGLVEGIEPGGDSDRLRIQSELDRLADNEMVAAIEACDGLCAVETIEGYDGAVAGLSPVQDRIIEALRRLLDVARHGQNEILAEMDKRSAGDLPPETREKLEEIRAKLEERLEQRKKVIEATENLAKKPVEDFSEEDEDLLAELAAAEDDWSKFLEDLHSDLSKLPEQDFANSSMLKELNEIQTEIKMAKDALTKKTADIAVPLEQLGAEMAEEIKTNLEKWLPDTPDRERWSQEESLSDAGKEAPMAELPGELEDLIGELMEEEEDLFAEMEDVSSSAADSLDKGAGWDVADGPISNMSAKGATGNRLPNTSEIGGRSGEGRSGKSSGEFVGDEAVGKGGRKTPSRLTPDPYVKGQIKDHSKDAQGGATGGGKESGQGAEGLEGPAPGPKGPRSLQRLAGKQGALRNKAEGIDIQRKVMAFHHTDLGEMLDLMARIEDDLRAGRYEHALRQRKVLAEGLGSVKQYVKGEFEIREDTSDNLPADIQEELLGSMEEASPAGWEHLNRRYFERLIGGKPKRSPAPETSPQE